MAFFLLELPVSARLNLSNGKNAVLIEAQDATVAKDIAKSMFGGDSDWGQATSTTVAAGMATNYTGFTYRVRIMGAAGAEPAYIDVSYTAGAETVSQIATKLAALLSGRAVGAAFQDDGGVFTNDTADINDTDTGDVDLYPAVPAAGDAFMFGDTVTFNQVTFSVSQVGTGTYTVTWEYWNGSAWAALAGVTDGSNSFKNTGKTKLTFTTPAAWVKKTQTGVADMFYVRAKIDAGTVTQLPLLTRAWIGRGTLASSSTNTLTVSAAGDSLGDRILMVDATPPGSELPANAALVGTITHRGSAGDATSVVLLDNAVIPALVKTMTVA